MVRPTATEWRNEAALLALTLVVAFATPPLFDQPPLNVLSLLFVALQIGSRVWHYRGRPPTGAAPPVTPTRHTGT